MGHLLGTYEVQIASPRPYCGGLLGEFVIIGKRGATYRTWRRADEQSVQFVASSGRFCALAGNYHLSLALVAGYAVTLTDANRI